MKPATKCIETKTRQTSTNRRGALCALLGGVALVGTARTAHAGINPAQIPTVMSVSATPTTPRRGTRVTVTARLTRLDNGRGVQSAPIRFFYGNPTYPNSVVASAVFTDATGTATFTFTVSQFSSPGANVILAEFTGNNFAQPLPFARLTVS